MSMGRTRSFCDPIAEDDKKISRGKISMLATIDREDDGDVPLRVNASAAKAYYKLLDSLRKAVKVKESIKLEHLLRFSEVIELPDLDNSDEQEWEITQQAVDRAVDDLVKMKRQEGRELAKDFDARIAMLEESVNHIEKLSREQVPNERVRLRDRIQQLLEKEPVDEGRLELEIALLADRLDVTEECVRFRSHNKYFREALADTEAAGRKLNFLVQEMNREANTIGSKSSSPEIAHRVVRMKEELEKVREQLQNVE